MGQNCLPFDINNESKIRLKLYDTSYSTLKYEIENSTDIFIEPNHISRVYYYSTNYSNPVYYWNKDGLRFTGMSWEIWFTTYNIA